MSPRALIYSITLHLAIKTASLSNHQPHAVALFRIFRRDVERHQKRAPIQILLHLHLQYFLDLADGTFVKQGSYPRRIPWTLEHSLKLFLWIWTSKVWFQEYILTNSIKNPYFWLIGKKWDINSIFDQLGNFGLTRNFVSKNSLDWKLDWNFN